VDPKPPQQEEISREKNWELFQKMSEFDDLNNGFMHIKRQITKNRKEVKSITNKRKHLIYDHYQTLENRYLHDEDKQKLIEEYKDKDPEEYESKLLHTRSNSPLEWKKTKIELALKMQKMKEDLEKEDEELSDEEEEEESEEENDDFEKMKQFVNSKMPKKIAQKGITSSLRPIEEESMELPSTQVVSEQFDDMTNEQKRMEVQRMMGITATSREETKADPISQEQNEEIHRRLGNNTFLTFSRNHKYDSARRCK